MRYTTIIDISQTPDLYRSESVRLLYLHLCMRCGYHDDDKGLIRQSIRAMASDTGLTISAVRHAMRVLEKWSLLKRHRGKLFVRNWCDEQPITTPAKRARKSRQQQQLETAAAIQREDQERRDQERREFLENFDEAQAARLKFAANHRSPNGRT